MKIFKAIYRLVELKKQEVKHLEQINKKLSELTACIDSNGRYGGAINATTATRY